MHRSRLIESLSRYRRPQEFNRGAEITLRAQWGKMARSSGKTGRRKDHIIISGTGRSGTTLLVQFFTALGFDTGYSLDKAKTSVDPISQAGLEPDLDRDEFPHVVKSPWFADRIGEILQRQDMRIEAAIVPIRDLYSVAESRRRVFFEAAKVTRKPLKHAGSLWKTNDPAQQELFLSLQFYRFVYPIIAHNIPLYFLHFPRFAHDPVYLFKTLSPLLGDYEVDAVAVSDALDKVVRPELINDFREDEVPSSRTDTSKGRQVISSLNQLRARVIGR